MPPPIALSKTRLLSFLQCPRKLWLEQYSPELEDEDAIDWAAIETGNVVGEMARKLYGVNGGHRIPDDRGLRAAVADTSALLETGGSGPVFEATFAHDGLTVQVDVLERAAGSTRIVEVKSATRVKDHYLHDCAIQAWTLSQCGHAPDRVVVAHIDSEFTYPGDGNYLGLFAERDVTESIAELVPGIADLVASTRAVLDELDEPEVPIGMHCTSPHPCPFYEHCAPAGSEYPVTGIGGSKALQYELMLEGYTDLRDVPTERLENETQRRIQQHTRSGAAFADPALRAIADSLDYPRYYLDFETIGFAIPVWAGTRPYQALPFQWSCHIQPEPGRLEHREFLDLSGEPPMRHCAEALIAALGDQGPVLVYTSYEKRVLHELAATYPDLAAALGSVAARLVDLHPLTRAHYYHPAMLGSWSIKAVLPTVAPELDYAQLADVRDGQAAQTAFLEAIRSDTSEARREQLRAALSEYCRYDTLALVRLVEFFGRC